MSVIAMSAVKAPICDDDASNSGNNRRSDVVEISLLLPSEWADHLMAMSRTRRQSIGQILRSMIGHALNEGTHG